MKIYDASVLVAVFLTTDTQHEAGIDIFTQEEEQIHIPYCIFVEVVSVLTYRANKNLAQEFIDNIMSDERVTIDMPTLDEEIFFWKYSFSGRISFNDSVAIFGALRNKCELVTFDHQMAQIHRKILQEIANRNK